jgi:murein DD-endopeptidase MepM/ murein hydrolase activator NlpD
MSGYAGRRKRKRRSKGTGMAVAAVALTLALSNLTPVRADTAHTDAILPVVRRIPDASPGAVDHFASLSEAAEALAEGAERAALEEAERLAREEAERLAREEAERLAREEAERLAREEAERLAREEAERLAREEEERRAREEAAATSGGSVVAPLGAYTVSTAFGVAGSVWASGYHTGLDLAAGYGEPIRSVAAGTVVFAGWDGAYGYKVAVRHGDGTESWYAHMSSIAVSGGGVGAGTVIGYVGSTGNSYGNHLHLEVRTGGGAIDPYSWLQARGVTL